METKEKYQQVVFDKNSVFDSDFLCSKSLYMDSFNKIPNITFISGIDGERAFEAIRSRYNVLVAAVHKYRYCIPSEKKCDFNETVMVLKNECILQFDTGYCEILHQDLHEDFVTECMALMKTFKRRARRKPLEINLISRGRNGLYLKAMEIKKMKLDLDLYYEDAFAEIDQIIRKRLNKEKDKGIVLLHGLPRTGKTTYLRYLVGCIRKKILFVSPGAAANIMDPEFIELLIDNPNSVLVIEDAENILMDRKISQNASVSNLLNISDGLLADFLNVQLICTFNNSLTLIDSALLRKGRLIAKYEFGKLSIEKSQRLSEVLGYQASINRPMTIAEISNQEEKDIQPDKIEVIGFRRAETLMN